MNDDGRKIAVLGLGPMGRALASAFAGGGHAVTVWNRTPGRVPPAPVPESVSVSAQSSDSASVPVPASESVPAPAISVAESVQSAVHAADVVVACLIDNEVVRRVVDGVDFGGRPLINLTSGDPGQARDMAAWAASRGIGYLPGAILTSTPMIGTPAGTVLLSGDAAIHAVVAPALSALGGRIVYLGSDPARASAFDVALLDLFATATNGLLHSFALAAAEGIAPTEFAAFATGIGALLPDMTTRFAEQLEAGDFPGTRSTIASAASGIRHVTAAARAHGLDTGMLDAVHTVIDRAVAQGYGSDGLGRLATAFRLELKPGRISE
ncbi:NAD(P)-dependent oxidoreductase [Catenulispora pinisilvae]|uniref:NAD(P)-dependent oxidoreductase n=1 Tax=Catenulispora pinisilvae TaxID=2705253 RepID=UPI0018925DD8|nr:NAD(P)-binding domain-containing protein [Catenulispora pinisilvae]